MKVPSGAAFYSFFVLLATLVPSLTTAQTSKSCDPATLSLDFTYSGTFIGGTPGIHILYQSKNISRGKGQIEIWDLRSLLWKRTVPLNSSGELQWNHLRDIPEAPSYLRLQLFDPHQSPGCIDDCGAPANALGAITDTVLVGQFGDSEGPAQTASADFMRLPQGAGWTDIDLAVSDFLADQPIVLREKNTDGEWQDREELSSTMIDLHHARVTIPPHYFNFPTELALGSYNPTLIYVAAREAPMLDSVEPSEILPEEAENGPVELILHGERFTPDSKVILGLDQADNLQNAIPSKYVSSSEIRVSLPSQDLIGPSHQRRTEKVRFYVSNGSPTLISEEAVLKVNASRKYPDPPQPRPRSEIENVSPFPVKRMDASSPEGLELQIFGKDFRSDEWIIAETDNDETRLRTEFVSPRELRAWLPREVWGHHLPRVRFIVETSSGTCTVEKAGDE